MEFRCLEPGETELFLSYPHPSPPGTGEAVRDFGAFTERGEYRPAWSWVALSEGRVTARCAFWAGPHDERPESLDWLEAEEPSVGTALLRAALAGVEAETLPEYHLFLPAGWQEDDWTRTATETRIAMAKAAGYERVLYRHNYSWAPADGIPPRSTRLRFAEATDEELLPVLRRILDGSLDDASKRDVAKHGADEAARIQLADLHWFPSPASWWRLAYNQLDDVVGVVIPARNLTRPVVGYVGVVPEHRGHGLIDDLLAYCTEVLAAELKDGEEVGADTDWDNLPMAACFARAGYRDVRTRIVLS